MTALLVQARTWLWAALVAIGAALLALAYAFGRRAEEAQQMRQRVRGAQERANADREAAAAADPVRELRAGGWVRGVAPGDDRARGQDQR